MGGCREGASDWMGCPQGVREWAVWVGEQGQAKTKKDRGGQWRGEESGELGCKKVGERIRGEREMTMRWRSLESGK